VRESIQQSASAERGICPGGPQRKGGVICHCHPEKLVLLVRDGPVGERERASKRVNQPFSLSADDFAAAMHIISVCYIPPALKWD